MTDEPTPITATWRGEKVYRCRLCAFDTLDRAKFEDHFAKAHPPFRIIDGGKADAPPETDIHKMTRDELNSYAETLGIADPENTETYPTKADVIAAIDAEKEAR